MKKAMTRVGIMLIWLGLWLSGFNYLFALDKGEQVPKGLRTKTEIKYKLESEAGKEKKVLVSKIISNYNAAGDLIDSDKYTADNKLTEKTVFKYDDKNNLLESVRYDADNKLTGKMTAQYDDMGNMTASVDYSPDGKLKDKIIYGYNDKENLMESSKYDADNKLIEKTLLRYDDKGNLIQSTKYDVDNKVTDKIVFKYDNKNHLIESLEGIPASKTMDGMDYQYDAQGNLFECTEYKLISDGGKENIKQIPQVQINWKYDFYTDTERVSIAKASELIRAYIFQETPGMNPQIEFPIIELTTQEIFQKMGFQVFKITSDVRESWSYIIKQNQVFLLSGNMGGFGIQSMCVGDINNDGESELVFTSSWGSGGHYNDIGICYNEGASVKESIVTWDFTYYDLFVRKQDNQHVIVEIAEVSADPRKFGKWKPLAKLGIVKTEKINGKLSCIVEEDSDLPDKYKKHFR